METKSKTFEIILESGLDLLRQNYRVTELDTGNMKEFTVDSQLYTIRQFEIENVGNLLIMTIPDSNPLKLDFFTITPYYKDLPLFSSSEADTVLFLNDLTAYIELEQDTPFLSLEKRIGIWQRNFEYAERLIKNSSINTEVAQHFFYFVFYAPFRYRIGTRDRLDAFLDQMDPEGITNRQKIRTGQKILSRLPETDPGKSFDTTSHGSDQEYHDGVVTEAGKTIGFGIHILNEDVYPLKYFHIYLRDLGLSGCLDLDGQKDMVFLDVYRNKIDSIRTGSLPRMRILGVQDNRLEALDTSGMPMCQGIDAGKNFLNHLDLSANPELVELYINDNLFYEIDLKHNKKLKYFYCHNNKIEKLDTRSNALLRHLNAADNPMREILALAPGRDEKLPLELRADGPGHIGLRFHPVYNAQWKETGEWEQIYYAYPETGYRLACWKDESGNILSARTEWKDTYGTSRILTAVFRKNPW